MIYNFGDCWNCIERSLYLQQQKRCIDCFADTGELDALGERKHHLENQLTELRHDIQLRLRKAWDALKNIRAIDFIINGNPHRILIAETELLRDVVKRALLESGNTGRPIEHYDVRDAKGSYLDVDRSISDYGFWEKLNNTFREVSRPGAQRPYAVRLFLSLNIGRGGNKPAPPKEAPR